MLARRFLRATGGSAMIEFALVLPPLLMLLLGAMEIGHAMWVQNALNYSVHLAARCASVDTSVCGSASQIQSYAVGLTPIGLSPSVFTVTTPACGTEVSASYQMTLRIPFVSYAPTLTAESCFPT